MYSGVGVAAQRHFGRSCIDGSCAAGQDLHDLTGMYDGDTAVVPADPTYSGPLYYKYDDDNGGAESLPSLLDPDISGDGRWVLQQLPLPAGGTAGTSASTARDNLKVPDPTKCLWFEEPVDTDDLSSIFTPENNIQITKVSCESDGTVNMDLQNDDGTPADIIGTDLACDSDGATACAAGCDTTINGDANVDSGDHIDLVVTSVSGGPTWVSICFTYNRL